MILTDSSVVVGYEQKPTPRLRGLILTNAAAVCGVTITEVFAGCGTPARVARSRAALADFQRVAFDDAYWEQAGLNQAALRRAGVTVQITDTAIATVAIALGLELWTYDAHFALMQGVLTGLRLFQEPP